MKRDAFGGEYLETAEQPIVGGRWVKFPDGSMYNTDTGVWKYI